jgi:hypothetical protein
MCSNVVKTKFSRARSKTDRLDFSEDHSGFCLFKSKSINVSKRRWKMRVLKKWEHGSMGAWEHGSMGANREEVVATMAAEEETVI